MQFGVLLRQSRLAAGLTQVELSALSGIAQGKVSKLESGKSLPSLLDLRRLGDTGVLDTGLAARVAIAATRVSL